MCEMWQNDRMRATPKVSEWRCWCYDTSHLTMTSWQTDLITLWSLLQQWAVGGTSTCYTYSVLAEIGNTYVAVQVSNGLNVFHKLLVI